MNALRTLMVPLVWLGLFGGFWLAVVVVAWLGHLVGRLLFIAVVWKILCIAVVWIGLVVGVSFLFSDSVHFEANAINHLWNLKRSDILSLDGAIQAALSNDRRTITLYDQNTGRKPARLDVDKDEFLSVAFSPDGKTLASGNHEVIRLWDVVTGKEQVSILGQGGYILCVAFSPDGKTLASGSVDGTVWLWDVATGKRRFLEEPRWLCDASMEDSPYCVTFSPDGKTLGQFNGTGPIYALGSRVEKWRGGLGDGMSVYPGFPLRG